MFRDGLVPVEVRIFLIHQPGLSQVTHAFPRMFRDGLVPVEVRIFLIRQSTISSFYAPPAVDRFFSINSFASNH
jgi:hypothetical protein